MSIARIDEWRTSAAVRSARDQIGVPVTPHDGRPTDGQPAGPGSTSRWRNSPRQRRLHARPTSKLSASRTWRPARSTAVPPHPRVLEAGPQANYDQAVGGRAIGASRGVMLPAPTSTY